MFMLTFHVHIHHPYFVASFYPKNFFERISQKWKTKSDSIFTYENMMILFCKNQIKQLKINSKQREISTSL